MSGPHGESGWFIVGECSCGRSARIIWVGEAGPVAWCGFPHVEPVEDDDDSENGDR